MEQANQAAATSPLRPETEKRLRVLAYHPRHASDPDAVLRLARETLGRPDLTHRTLTAVCEGDALRLIAAIEAAFPDKRSAAAAKVKRELLNRPD